MVWLNQSLFSITIGGTYSNHFLKGYICGEAEHYKVGLCACLQENILSESPI
jgi:hypothetical protein